ncbi:Ig-like domain-containing protein [Pseudoxanthomonas mexicana]
MIADIEVFRSALKGSGSDNASVLFDPESNTFESREGPESTPPPGLAASLPRQGEMDASTTARLSVRFAQRIRFGDLTEANVTLIGPGGAASIRVTPAEHGRLVFVTPRQELFPGAAYTLLINGVHTIQDRSVPLIAVDFSTASSSSEEIGVVTFLPQRRSLKLARRRRQLGDEAFLHSLSR